MSATPARASSRGASSKEDELHDSSAGQLPVDVHQTPSEIVIRAFVAGVRPDELSISISREMVEIQRSMLRDAVAAGQLGPGADSEEAVHLLGSLICGVCTMAMANEPGATFGAGRFTPVFPRLLALLPALYPPD